MQFRDKTGLWKIATEESTRVFANTRVGYRWAEFWNEPIKIKGVKGDGQNWRRKKEKGMGLWRLSEVCCCMPCCLLIVWLDLFYIVFGWACSFCSLRLLRVEGLVPPSGESESFSKRVTKARASIEDCCSSTPLSSVVVHVTPISGLSPVCNASCVCLAVYIDRALSNWH